MQTWDVLKAELGAAISSGWTHPRAAGSHWARERAGGAQVQLISLISTNEPHYGHTCAGTNQNQPEPTSLWTHLCWNQSEPTSLWTHLFWNQPLLSHLCLVIVPPVLESTRTHQNQPRYCPTCAGTHQNAPQHQNVPSPAAGGGSCPDPPGSCCASKGKGRLSAPRELSKCALLVEFALVLLFCSSAGWVLGKKAGFSGGFCSLQRKGSVARVCVQPWL